MRTLSIKKNLDAETENLSSLRNEPRIQQIENEDPRSAFSSSFLPKPP